MTKPSSELCLELKRKYKSLELTRKKVESLYSSKALCSRDINLVYEGLFISTHTIFENFLEDLFIGLLVDGRGLKSSRADICPRIRVKNHQIAKEVIIGSSRRKYITWVPFENTILLAKIFFREGRPFTDLNEGQKRVLSNCLIIRDVLAHKSHYSIEKFKTNFLVNANIPLREHQPASYLRGVFRNFPPQSRYENFASELARIACDLSR